MNFDFLNKLSHQHNKNQSSQINPIINSLQNFQSNQFAQQLSQQIIQKNKKTQNYNLPQNKHEKEKNINLFNPTLQQKLYPLFQYNDQEKSKKVLLPSQHLSPRRPPPSDYSINIIKQILKKQQSTISPVLKQLIYLRRQKVQQQVYNYATSVNRNQFVTGVMEVIDNFAAPSMEQIKLKKDINSKSFSSLTSMNIKFDQKQYNPYIHMSIYSLIGSITDKFVDQIIYTTHFKIHKKAVFNKDDIQHLNKMDEKRLIQIKNNHKTIQNNLSFLRSQMHHQYASNKKGLLDIQIKSDINNYSTVDYNDNHNKNSSIKIPKSQRKFSKKTEKLSGIASIYSIDQDLLKNDKDYYSIRHPRTKQAAKFVEELQKKKLFNQLQYQDNKQKQKKKYIKKVEKAEQERKRAISQKHQRLIKQFQKKRQQKMIQKQKAQQSKMKFQSFLNQYQKKKPLFMKLLNDYQKNQNEEQQLKNKKLEKIKEAYKPMDYDQLNNHQQKYLDQKQQYKVKKQAEIQRMNQDLNFLLNEMSNLHHGKFHNIIIEQMQQIKRKYSEDPNQEVKQRIKKRQQYGQKVKMFYPPKVDPNKRIQSLSFLQNSKSKKPGKYIINKRYDSRFAFDSKGQQYFIQNYPIKERSNASPEIQHDSKKQGLRNLRIVKQYIRQQKQKGLVVDQEKRKASQSVTLQPPKINYLNELKKERQLKPKQSLDSKIQRQINRVTKSTKQKNSQAGYLKIRAQEIDQKVKRRQLILRNNNHRPQQQKMLEQQYLSSIKLKLQLMKQFD